MRLLLLSLLVAVATPASADPGPPAIDEAQLLARLAEHDPRLARIAAAIDAARAEVAAAAVRPNPTVSIEREEVFPDGGQATSYLRLEVPLELSGRRGLRADAARAEVSAVTTAGERAHLAAVVDALRTFRTAAYERLRLELLRTERAALVKAVEVVRKRTGAGAASGYDLQRIELELAMYDDQIAAGEAQLAASRAALGALAGTPDGADANDALALPPDPPALDALVATVAQHPDYRAATTRIGAARTLARAARRAWIPELTLSGGLIAQDLGAATARGYTAGVFVGLPIFEHGQVDRARAAAQAQAAQAERAVLARDLPAAIRAAHAAYVQTLARARASGRLQIARLDQLLRSAETAYREGGANVVELLDAHRTARDTRLHELALRRDARVAELELWLALGRRP